MKAIIKVGGKQYIVTEKQTLLVDKLEDAKKELKFEPLMVFDGASVTVGAPLVKGAAVTASVIEEEVKGDKIQVVRFKSKKRVKKITGHRQQYSQIKITKITAK